MTDNDKLFLTDLYWNIHLWMSSRDLWEYQNGQIWKVYINVICMQMLIDQPRIDPINIFVGSR